MCCMWAPIGSHLRTDGTLPRQDRTPRPRYRHLLWPLIAARYHAAIAAWRARGAVTHIPAAAIALAVRRGRVPPRLNTAVERRKANRLSL